MKQKILIVDDVEVNRSILAFIFRERFDIVEAGDGQAALDCVMKEQDNLSIILLDIHMPIMGGFDVLKELNTNRLIKKIPVILITGDDSSDSERVGYEYGVSDIIRKPFDPQVVLARVNNVVELYQQRKERLMNCLNHPMEP